MEKLIKNLDKFQIPYKKSGDDFIIKVGRKQEIIVFSSGENKISISDRFCKFNSLSGFRRISLKKAIIHQSTVISIFWILLLFVTILLDLEQEILSVSTLIFVPILIILCFAATFYHIRIENVKQTIIRWLEE